jgi:hypothetical protein
MPKIVKEEVKRHCDLAFNKAVSSRDILIRGCYSYNYE